MWSPRSLKVINSLENSQVIQELLADCQNVGFSPFSTQSELTFFGHWSSNLRILTLGCPEKAQVGTQGIDSFLITGNSNGARSFQLFSFRNNITACKWSSADKLIVTFASNELAVVTKLKEEWSSKVHTFSLYGGKLIDCFPLSDGLLLFIRMLDYIFIGFSKNPPEWEQVAKLDCIEETVGGIQVTLSPKSKPLCPIILIGTEDGHVYELQLKPNSAASSTLLCDIQQPVAYVMDAGDNVIIVGKYGKITQITTQSKEASTSFAPTAVSSSIYSKSLLYLMGSEQLYSMELKRVDDGCVLGEAIYCKVKFVRAFHLDEDALFILTENGAIYKSSLAFELPELELTRQRNGAEIKPILLEIHRSTDETKALNDVSEQVWHNVSQLSIALHMLSEGIADQFPVVVRSFSDPISPRNQRLVISIINKSSWNFSTSHWSLQLSALPSELDSILLKQEWKKGEELELEHRLSHLDDSFAVQVRIALVFRITDSRKSPLESLSFCVFPLQTVEMTLLDFLEPGVLQDFDALHSQSELVGFSKNISEGVPWQLLLHRSWHRGFATWIANPPPMKIVLLCGTSAIRMSLTEEDNQTDKLWILRMESSNPNLLKLLRSHIYRLIEQRQPIHNADYIRLPGLVSAQLQSLNGRLNYIQSLSHWERSDIEPIMEEIHLLMAKQFSIR